MHREVPKILVMAHVLVSKPDLTSPGHALAAMLSLLGQSRRGRAYSRPSHVAFPPIPTEFCGAAKFRDGPNSEVKR
jgi:hypothetical protein